MSGQQGGLGGQRPAGFNPGLNQSLNNNFYTSNVAASQFNGSGAQVQADKLNLSRNAPAVTVKPGQVQYVEQPVEQVQVVKREQLRGGGRVLNPLDPNLRNLIAESQAKIALLLMENNRVKWNIAQKDAEIARLRTTGTTQVVVAQPTVVRTSNTVVRPSNVVVTQVQPTTTTTLVQPSTVVHSTVPTRTVVSGTTVTTGAPVSTVTHTTGPVTTTTTGNTTYVQRA